MSEHRSEYGWSGHQVSQFVDAHAAAAVWTVTGDTDNTDRLAASARERLDREAREFVDAHENDLVTWLSPAHAGYDLWMTRAGEGAGFWSRYLPTDPTAQFSAYALADRRHPDKVAQFDRAMTRLSDGANALGQLDLYEGDDGALHV